MFEKEIYVFKINNYKGDEFSTSNHTFAMYFEKRGMHYMSNRRMILSIEYFLIFMISDNCNSFFSTYSCKISVEFFF